MKITNNHYPDHAFPQHWSARELADAVPLRLCELVEFPGALLPASNRIGPARSPRWSRHDYLRADEPSAFIRVR